MGGKTDRPAAGRGPAWTWIAAALSAVAGFASAATLQISPVSIELGPGEPGAAIILRNPGATPMFGQLRVYAWDQQEGEDVLTPTRELAASPPLLEVAPGSEQLVRIVRTGPKGVAKEAAYRILIDEIRNEQAAPRNGVRILMRYSVPVFVDDGLAASAKPLLIWSLDQKNGRWRLTAENRGARRARISQAWLRDAQGRRHPVAEGLLGYALAGRRHAWQLDIPANVELDAGATIDAYVDSDHVIEPVGMRPPPSHANAAEER